MKELRQLTETLRSLDENGEFSLLFYGTPQNRFRTVQGLLNDIIAQTARAHNLTMDTAQHLLDTASTKLMSQFWEHTWTAHDVHFHKNFKEFCNCPFTCLTEIADCIERVANS